MYLYVRNIVTRRNGNFRLFYGRIVTVAHGPASREADGKDFAAICVPTDETLSPTNAHKSLKLVEQKPRHISVRVFLGSPLAQASEVTQHSGD